MTAYYNDNEPFVCAWMRELMDEGLITRGVIDQRSILEVQPDDVRHYTRCHWFAGIAGWDYALQLAGWPDDRPVWTASLPCQPFSVAGKRAGERDDRHLWDVFHALVCECRPATIFGEQVAAAVRMGWLERVFTDLEALGYRCGAADLPACSVGAPHIRQRIYWVADRIRRTERSAHGGECGNGRGQQSRVGEGRQIWGDVADRGPTGGVGDTDITRPQGRGLQPGQRADQRSAWVGGAYILCADGKSRLVEPSICPLVARLSTCLDGLRSIEAVSIRRVQEYGALHKTNTDEVLRMVQRTIQSEACWQDQTTRMCLQLPTPEVLLDYMLCLKATLSGAAIEGSRQEESREAQRRLMRSVCVGEGNLRTSYRRKPNEQPSVESSNPVLTLSFLLAWDCEAYRQKTIEANAASCRVGLLRGAGNAIVPPLAAEFVRAFMETSA